MGTKPKAGPKPRDLVQSKMTNHYTGASLDEFKTKEFLTEAIDLYFRDKGKKITNLSKQNMAQLKEGITRRNVPLPELAKFYNTALDNAVNAYSDSNSDKIIKLRKKWKQLYIVPNADFQGLNLRNPPRNPPIVGTKFVIIIRTFTNLVPFFTAFLRTRFAEPALWGQIRNYQRTFTNVVPFFYSNFDIFGILIKKYLRYNY